MGFAARQIIDQFPPWWSFLFPTDETDRKNWSLVRNGVTYVSTSKAVRNNGITFINNSTTLDICPICSKVMNHKALVYMRYIVWKEKYTGSDLLNWMTVNQKACYVHWRSSDSKLIKNRNPWVLDNLSRKRRNPPESRFSRSSSPPQLGPAVLPYDQL